MGETHARAGGEYIAVLMSRDGLTRVIKMMGAQPPQEIKLPLAPPYTKVDVSPVTAGEHRTYRLAGTDEAFGMPAYRFLESI